VINTITIVLFILRSTVDWFVSNSMTWFFYYYHDYLRQGNEIMFLPIFVSVANNTQKVIDEIWCNFVEGRA